MTLSERYRRMHERQARLRQTRLKQLEIATYLELAGPRGGPPAASLEVERRTHELERLHGFHAKLLRYLDDDRRWLDEHGDEELAACDA